MELQARCRGYLARRRYVCDPEKHWVTRKYEAWGVIDPRVNFNASFVSPNHCQVISELEAKNIVIFVLLTQKCLLI